MYVRDYNVLEQTLSKDFHGYEDFIRNKMISGKKLSKNELLLVARFLLGRTLNASVSESKKIDGEHSKAQVRTLSCLATYLYRHKDSLDKTEWSELYRLLYFYLNKIDEFIYDKTIETFLDKKYHDYCIKWIFYCNNILNDMFKNDCVINIDEYINEIFMSIGISTIKNIKFDKKLSTYLSRLNISDFI